jgi:hypothetical protein
VKVLEDINEYVNALSRTPLTQEPALGGIQCLRVIQQYTSYPEGKDALA